MDLSIPANMYSTQSITANTNVRDVSQLLEMWAHRDTPFLNKLTWGEESGGLVIEWLTEHLGWMYVETSGAIGSGDTSLLAASLGTGYLTGDEQTKQIRVGSLLYARASSDLTLSGGHSWLLVTTIDTSATITVAFMSGATASIPASSKIYIIGSFANEGSEPDRDTSRGRTLLSNNFSILRKDIRITGSQAATDMHAIGNELSHQMAARLLELQFERERSFLYSWQQARSGSAESTFQGMAEVLLGQSTQNWVDDTTTALTEDAVNDLVAECFENGGRPNVIVGATKQIRKFTGFATDRIRSRPDDRIGGEWITQYLTDTGITVDLVPLKKAIPNFLFVLDTTLIRPRAKRGRKLLFEPLGIEGDYREYQYISEYSMEHHGVAHGKQGMFSILA